MSRDRAASISNINSKYGTSARGSYLYPAPTTIVDVVPTVYQVPESRVEAVRAVKYFDQQSSRSGISKWVFILLGVLLVAAVVGGIYYFYGRSRNSEETIVPIYGKSWYSDTGIMKCGDGFVEHDGKCVGCPSGFSWSGSACVVSRHKKSREFRPQELASFIHRTYDPSSGFGVGHSHRHRVSHQKVVMHKAMHPF